MSSHEYDQMDAFDRDLLRSDDSPPPAPQFVAQLRSTLRQEASRSEALPPKAWPALRAVPPRTRPVRLSEGPRRMPGRWASLGLVAVVLLMIVSVGALTYRPESSDPTSIPAGYAATPSPELADIPDVPMPGANPARTNVQPGPGLTTLPEIVQRSNQVGRSMVLADGLLVIVDWTTVTALDATTLAKMWSTDLVTGAYSAPVVADGQIYIGVARNTEAGIGEAEENLLVALSMIDGQELWRMDGAGVQSVSPIVDGDIVYSVGVSEGQYRLGAYRTESGEPVWQTLLGPFAGCCPPIGIALANEMLAVNGLTSPRVFQPTGLGVYDAANGGEIWAVVPGGGWFVGPPMIIDALLVVNVATEPLEDVYREPKDGMTVAYRLASGDVAWTNKSSRAYWAPIAASSGVMYTGPRQDATDNGQLALLSLDTGEAQWTIPMPRMEGDAQTYISPPREAAPVIVGDTVYVVGSTPPNGGQSVQASLISAVDLESGTIRWMAQVDGGVISTPIVVDGRIFLLTSDAGMYVLGSGDVPVSGTPTIVDLRTPVTCDAAPSESPLLSELAATPSIPGVADWKQMIPFSQIPSGTRGVDPNVAEQLDQIFREYRACSDVDPYNSVFDFFSTDFYVRLQDVEQYWGEPDQPWAVWMAPMQEFLYLDTNSLQTLPDGRIGGVVNSPQMNFYVWWVMEDGQWKIDEYHRIEADPVDPNVATPEGPALG